MIKRTNLASLRPSVRQHASEFISILRDWRVKPNVKKHLLLYIYIHRHTGIYVRRYSLKLYAYKWSACAHKHIYIHSFNKYKYKYTNDVHMDTKYLHTHTHITQRWFFCLMKPHDELIYLKMFNILLLYIMSTINLFNFDQINLCSGKSEAHTSREQGQANIHIKL